MECVLEMLLEEEGYLLMPMYACQLPMEAQARWYRSVMRHIDDGDDPAPNSWFLVHLLLNVVE